MSALSLQAADSPSAQTGPLLGTGAATAPVKMSRAASVGRGCKQQAVSEALRSANHHQVTQEFSFLTFIRSSLGPV